jgi:hypothetical protein
LSGDIVWAVGAIDVATLISHELVLWNQDMALADSLCNICRPWAFAIPIIRRAFLECLFHDRNAIIYNPAWSQTGCSEESFLSTYCWEAHCALSLGVAAPCDTGVTSWAEANKADVANRRVI